MELSLAHLDIEPMAVQPCTTAELFEELGMRARISAGRGRDLVGRAGEDLSATASLFVAHVAAPSDSELEPFQLAEVGRVAG